MVSSPIRGIQRVRPEAHRGPRGPTKAHKSSEARRSFQKRSAAGRAGSASHLSNTFVAALLDGDRRAGFFELLLPFLGFVLVDALEERLGRFVDQRFGFLEAQVGASRAD